jgi:hypothetical protein
MIGANIWGGAPYQPGDSTMKVLGNVVTVGQEVTAVSKAGTQYSYRPILVNGEELGRAFRKETIKPTNGQNVRTVRWETGSNSPVKIYGLSSKDIVKSLNQNGKEYFEVPVVDVPKGVQAKAFPSQFDASMARLHVTVYGEYAE